MKAKAQNRANLVAFRTSRRATLTMFVGLKVTASPNGRRASYLESSNYRAELLFLGLWLLLD